MEPPLRVHSRFSRSRHLSRLSFDTAVRSPDEHWEDMSSRPKSMTDFQSLLDASTPVNGQGYQRKKPSISLAQGLMMDSPRTLSIPDAPPMARPSSANGPWSENLFYAYAQKVYTTVFTTPLLHCEPLNWDSWANHWLCRATTHNRLRSSLPLPLPQSQTIGGR